MKIGIELEKEFEIGSGHFEKFSIRSFEKNVGRLSIIKFQINEPFTLGWEFIDEIYVEPKYRHQGIAKNVLIQIGTSLSEKSKNGILENAVAVVEARHLYDDLGWTRLRWNNNWQILQNVEVSTFVTRKAYDFVNKNLIGWQASSLN